jgi:hypothetical protein
MVEARWPDSHRCPDSLRRKMALDAGPFMRLGTRGSPSWPGFDPETGYVDAEKTAQIRSRKLLADGAGHTFSAAFTLWLSMIAAVELASRPACSRYFTSSA